MPARKSYSRPDLDDRDKAILRLLQQDNKMPHRLIAEQVNLSAPAVQRRIARLEADGVIRANVAVIDPASVGLGMSVVVEVHPVSDQLSVVDPLKAQLKDTPEVQQCLFVSGNGGFIVVLLVRDTAHYTDLSRQLFAGNPLVHQFRTMVVLDPVKVSLSIDL